MYILIIIVTVHHSTSQYHYHGDKSIQYTLFHQVRHNRLWCTRHQERHPRDHNMADHPQLDHINKAGHLQMRLHLRTGPQNLTNLRYVIHDDTHVCFCSSVHLCVRACFRVNVLVCIQSVLVCEYICVIYGYASTLRLYIYWWGVPWYIIKKMGFRNGRSLTNERRPKKMHACGIYLKFYVCSSDIFINM